MSELVVIDYGLNNLNSVVRALRHVGGHPVVSRDPADLERAERVVLPGVGAFGPAMQALGERGFVQAIRAFARSGRPLLGLCLGMQLFMQRSSEMGDFEGLGLLSGKVTRLSAATLNGERFKVPHVGWAELLPAASWDGTPLRQTKAGDSVYFTHSFRVEPANPEDSLAETQYGPLRFCSVVHRGSITGCQFHPEKSGPAGLGILANFIRDS